jgi:hypothetical protein
MHRDAAAEELEGMPIVVSADCDPLVGVSAQLPRSVLHDEDNDESIAVGVGCRGDRRLDRVAEIEPDDLIRDMAGQCGDDFRLAADARSGCGRVR